MSLLEVFPIWVSRMYWSVYAFPERLTKLCLLATSDFSIFFFKHFSALRNAVISQLMIKQAHNVLLAVASSRYLGKNGRKAHVVLLLSRSWQFIDSFSFRVKVASVPLHFKNH